MYNCLSFQPNLTIFFFQRSYAAVVRNNINTSVVHLALNINKNENNTSNNNNKIGRTEKQAIIIESGIDSKSAMSCKAKPLGGASAASNQACGGGGPDIEVIGEDVHPYLKQLEQALELEIKYR